VPGAARERPVAVPKDGDELTAGLDEPPGRQAGLAEERHAVALADFRRLAADVERLAHLAGTEERERQLLELIERGGPLALGVTIQPQPLAVELGQQRAAEVQA